MKYMGITENARSMNIPYYDSSWTRAVTVRDHPGFIPDTVEGRPRIFLNLSRFDSINPGNDIRHEMMHAGGANAVSNWFGSDLSHLGYTLKTFTHGIVTTKSRL